MTSLVPIARELRDRVRGLAFGPPVSHVYDPLDYAWRPHRAYLERFGRAPREVLLLGMNPGPWGMAQTGVPFGDVRMVREWLGIEAPVGRPAREHARRPVTGFGCHRGEVSGQRLWGWARRRFSTPERFFSRFFVWNYCPLCFIEASGRNRTPDRLPRKERDALYPPCDAALRRVVAALAPRYVVGLGRFAESRAAAALAGIDVTIGFVPHPSPASPQANRAWDLLAERALRRLGIALGD